MKNKKGKLMVRPVAGQIVIKPRSVPKGYSVQGQVVTSKGKVVPKEIEPWCATC